MRETTGLGNTGGACPIQNREHATILLDYCDRKLDRDTRAWLDRHVADCPSCSQFLASQKAVWDALDAWTPEPVTTGFDGRVMARIHSDAPQSRWSQWVDVVAAPFAFKPLLPVAAACLVLIAVVWYRSGDPAPELSNAPIPPAVEVEQIESVLSDIEILQSLGVSTVPGLRNKGGSRKAI